MPTRLATFHLRRKINFLAFSSCQVLKLSQVVMIDHCKVAWRPSKGFFVSWVMSLAKRGNLGENVTDQWKFSYRGTRSNSFWVVFFLISQKLFYRKRSEVMHIFIEIASQLIKLPITDSEKGRKYTLLGVVEPLDVVGDQLVADVLPEHRRLGRRACWPLHHHGFLNPADWIWSLLMLIWFFLVREWYHKLSQQTPTPYNCIGWQKLAAFWRGQKWPQKFSSGA